KVSSQPVTQRQFLTNRSSLQWVKVQKQA
ncbi:pyridine nucleotide-disulfide oxidoreductase family protein, partial [Vibrio parahaemolyticus V-223/04]